ncbi:MAG: type II toxin-antitoxin system HicB family antitoxin [Pseudomonadota bacterium]
MIIEYIALAEKVGNGYTVFIPDFPGFGSAGKTLELARKNTREGLIAHIELMIEAQESIPQPTSLDSVMKLKDAKGCIPLFIAIVSPSGKAHRVNITIDSALLNAIDHVAQSQHKSRSALLSEAARRLLGDM